MPTRVKICCISGPRELKTAAEAGAFAVGLVSAMPSGPGVISDRRIVRLAGMATPSLETFLLTSQTQAAAIIAQHRASRVTTLQICDALAKEIYSELRAAMPTVTLVQVIHVQGEASLTEATQIAPFVDRLLLDTGNPDLAVKELGGTGRTHNWQISHRICRAVNIPVLLAGGLRPDNVAAAIAEVRPWGVDVCSGVRTGGKLDAAKLRDFMQAVAGAG